MDRTKLEFFNLLLARLEAASERRWYETRLSPELTAQEAQGKVSEVFKNQLLEGISPKSPGGNVVIGLCDLQMVFPSLPPSEDEVIDAITRSQDEYYVFQALRLLARLKIAPDSKALKTWERNLLSGLISEPPLPKGPSPYRDAHRNMLIVSQIEQLQMAGFKPMRNMQRSVNGTTVPSGCDIVAEALASVGRAMMTYQAVALVWKKRKEQPKPEYLAELMTQATLGRYLDTKSSDK